MKAYVIKNKEGLYYTTHLNYEDIHTEDISEASIYDRKIANDIKLFLDKTTCQYGEKWEVVEITIAEGDLEQEIEELKTRISELEDKDWYEKCISQLEEQNDKLIKERDEIQKELETSVDYWKNEVFKKMEVKLTGVTKEKIQEIRKQVCDEIRNSIEVAKLRYMWEGKSLEISKILDKIEKGEE